MGYNQNSIRFYMPVVIGTKSFYSDMQNVSMSLRSQTDLPPTPIRQTESSHGCREQSAPDDDTVSIRTYASTPPPFPDDEFDLPTYDEAMLQEININQQTSFPQLFTPNQRPNNE
ncbi:uncharacterized protein LOC116350524 [Contarinia nasturtii]|uniref:uncharacterized protein LOC116350524 n=1 Tax=Contarinia nasturtii TaxID=265458 RepID=UPI0012D45594|nr:uncharacterized protein LOC116350524 [Contarinia nasturtii]